MQLGENGMNVECLIIKHFINDSICDYYLVLLNRIFLKAITMIHLEPLA